VLLSKLSIQSKDVAGIETVTLCADPLGLNFAVGLKGTAEMSDQLAHFTAKSAGKVWTLSRGMGAASRNLDVQRQGNSWIIGTSVVVVRAMIAEQWFDRADIVHLPLAAKFSERQLKQMLERKGARSASVANATGLEISLSDHTANVNVVFSDREHALKALDTSRLALAQLRAQIAPAIGRDPSASLLLKAFDGLTVEAYGSSVRAVISLDRETVKKLAEIAMGAGVQSNKTAAATP
jgi:hypothetical protein